MPGLLRPGIFFDKFNNNNLLHLLYLNYENAIISFTIYNDIYFLLPGGISE